MSNINQLPPLQNGNGEKNIVKIYSKDSIIKALKNISKKGWILNARPGNAGGIGNTLEDLLGIEENNLPIPNAAEWELKTQRANSTALTTEFHIEPSPTAIKFVPRILLPKYGWPHKEAGIKYPLNEMSFRQTINIKRSSRGFCIKVNRSERKIEVSFDATAVSKENAEWLESVKQRVGNLDELNPQPYWGFDDLFHVVGTKLKNCFYIKAEVKRIGGNEYFFYNDILVLQDLNIDKFIDSIEQGYVYADFDARTGHNHGTKFRLRSNIIPSLYLKVDKC